MSMFCYQCQEATQGIGCTRIGACGKEEEVSAIQDLLLLVCQSIAIYNHELRQQNQSSSQADDFIIHGLFMTITNANFDYSALEKAVIAGLKIKVELAEKCQDPLLQQSDPCLNYRDPADYFKKDKKKNKQPDEDIRSLKSLIIYGIKGMAAYAEHALHLEQRDEKIIVFMQRALAATTRDDIILDELINLTLETGRYGVEVMALLDQANTSHFGHPELTHVPLGVGQRPGILITGHDLRDLEELLAQSIDSGVDIYTHCEMLPAHYYPQLKKYPHLRGHYGGAWWQQKEDFRHFNGPILFTTNCIVPPGDNALYRHLIFTTGAAGFPDASHIADRHPGGKKDFSSIINMAKQCQPPKQLSNGTLIGGFAHHQLTALAENITQAIQSGKISQFVVMAGCDGRMKSRQYYTDFALALPKDTIILTAGCAKFRYNQLPLGTIDGIPRVLDAGQCNDSYSLVVIALKLKEILGLNDINQLPIIYNIAWYEQKAVIVLLALLFLGIKNIHLGPTLPAFLSKNVTELLIKTFGISSISNVENDMKVFLS